MQKIMFNDRYGLTQAVIEGRKTMTRRLINPMPKDCTADHKNYWGADWSDEPMSLVVDRDAGGIYCEYCGNGVKWFSGGYDYKAKYKVGEVVAVAQSYRNAGIGFVPNRYDGSKWGNPERMGGWNSKMLVRADLMPHRIRITDIRCERLQEISDEDCIREGILEDLEGVQYSFPSNIGYCGQYPFGTPRAAFAALIDKVSGRGTWERNPWVVVYEFELVK